MSKVLKTKIIKDYDRYNFDSDINTFIRDIEVKDIKIISCYNNHARKCYLVALILYYVEE